MFGPLGFAEITFIIVLALLIFGPRKLPEMARALGKSLGEFRRASSELKRTFNAELSLDDDDERPAVSRRPARDEPPGERPAPRLEAARQGVARGATDTAPAPEKTSAADDSPESGEIAAPPEG